jgi:DNA polymerase II small subunit/DNA polymerase delta subunit B
MDKAEIVSIFIKAGYQLSADALQHFEQHPEQVQEFLNLVPGKLEKPFVTRQVIDQILSGVSPRVKVIKSFLRKKGEIKPGDIADTLAKRYENISEILSKKPELVNLISINRISPENRAFSIIAMVREIDATNRSLVVEDPTGSTSIFVSDLASGEFPYIVEDEVVGIVCDNEDSAENRAIKIVFPGIPIQMKAAAANRDVFCMFVSDIHMDEGAFMQYSFEKFADYLRKIKEETFVFVLGDISGHEEDVKRFMNIFPENFRVMTLKGHLDDEEQGQLPDPVMVEIDGVKIFLSHGSMFQKYKDRFSTSAENTLLQLLKKRHLSPIFDPFSQMDDGKMFLDQVPDIAVIGHFHEPHIMNYKGTTIMTLGSFVGQPIFWMVNLRTRETVKIDFS